MSQATFGATLSVSGSAVLGLTDLTLPRLQHSDLLDKMTHDNSGGIMEKIHPKTFVWVPGSATFDVRPADAGQVAIASAAVGTAAVACVFTKPGVTAVTVSCFITIEEGANPVNGVETLTATFTPTGAAS
jgi:hypothetical protein